MSTTKKEDREKSIPTECKYCGSTNLVKYITDANLLRCDCGDCGKYQKFLPIDPESREEIKRRIAEKEAVRYKREKDANERFIVLTRNEPGKFLILQDTETGIRYLCVDNCGIYPIVGLNGNPVRDEA